MKKHVILGMVVLMIVSLLSTGVVFAAGQPSPLSKDVPVSYDNRNAVVDPDNPLAEWSVSIPTAVAFAKDKTPQNVDVELVPINGAALADIEDTVTVNAKSTNGLELLSEDDAAGAGLDYTVVYGSTNLTGKTDVTIATLTKDNATQAGTAKLGTDKPAKLAIYSDTLTYTISKATII